MFGVEFAVCVVCQVCDTVSYLHMYQARKEGRFVARLDAPELCFRECVTVKKCGSLSISWSCVCNFA
jgi:hypothetical protein